MKIKIRTQSTLGMILKTLSQEEFDSKCLYLKSEGTKKMTMIQLKNLEKQQSKLFSTFKKSYIFVCQDRRILSISIACKKRPSLEWYRDVSLCIPVCDLQLYGYLSMIVSVQLQ